MIPRMIVALSLMLALSGGNAIGQGNKQVAEDVAKAQELVNASLKKLGGPGARVTHVADDTLKKAFPDQVFFAVLFPQFPVGRQPPQPLKVANIFYVKGGEVKFLSEVRALEQFFKTHLRKAKDAAAAKESAKAYLRLSQELHQDGFYRFSIPDGMLSEKAETESRKVTGKAIVEPKGGNKGEIVATLTFDKEGKLTQVAESAKLVAGIRPICQSTRLLDADPLVRQMAEQSLLVLGAAGKEYLDRQRALAGPELRAAIDRLWQRIVDEGR
jgi:hypothetical protein